MVAGLLIGCVLTFAGVVRPRKKKERAPKKQQFNCEML